MNFTGESQVTGISDKDVYLSTDRPQHRLGTLARTRDGRLFRYCKAGAVALVPGNVIQSPAIVTAHLALTSAAQAIGDKAITVTPGAVLGTENQYAEGYLSVDTTPGNGRQYGISGHKAFASATAFTLNLENDDPLDIAFTTATRYGLIANPYNGVIQMPVTTATGTFVGIAVSIIPIGGFGWVQTWGIAPVLISGTPALGAEVMSPGAVAGAAEVVVAAGTLIVAQMIGHMAQVGVSGKNNAVFVRLG